MIKKILTRKNNLSGEYLAEQWGEGIRRMPRVLKSYSNMFSLMPIPVHVNDRACVCFTETEDVVVALDRVIADNDPETVMLMCFLFIHRESMTSCSLRLKCSQSTLRQMRERALGKIEGWAMENLGG